MRRADVWQEGFEEEVVLPLARMVYGEIGQSYVALARPEGANLVGKLTNVLKFTVKEIDPTTGEHLWSLSLDVLGHTIIQGKQFTKSEAAGQG